jgi:hypothetical protein
MCGEKCTNKIVQNYSTKNDGDIKRIFGTYMTIDTKLRRNTFTLKDHLYCGSEILTLLKTET